MGRLLSSVAIVIVGCLGCSSSPPAQCNATCVSTVVISTSYQGPFVPDGGPDPIVGSAVRVCVNTAQCSTGTMSTAPGATLTGAFQGQATVSSGVLSATVEPSFPAVHDGDVWSLHVTATDGTVLLDLSKATSYTQQTVCGTQCASATIQM